MNPAWEHAVTHGDVESARRLLQTGQDIDARDRHGQTALMLAAHQGHQTLLELLLENGADLNVTAKYHLSALMLAVVAGHTAIARLLARAGADRDIRGTGAPGFAGKTAYDLMVERGMDELRQDLQP